MRIRVFARRHVAAAGVFAVLLLAVAGTASASVAAYNEPGYTKTANNNSYWFSWIRENGVDSNGNTDTTFYVCYSTSQNGALVEMHSGHLGPGSTGCTANLSGSSGNLGMYPFAGTATTLSEGSNYTTCASRYIRNVFIWSGSSSVCSSSVIDRTPPSIVAYVNGTDEYTKNPLLNYRIHYEDTVSPPWPANYVCITAGSPCTPTAYNVNCSTPYYFNNRVNDFFCQSNASAAPDGPVYFCARSADSGIPDNATGTNQFILPSGAAVTSDNANISTAQCGYVILDRVAPTVVANASATTVTVGQLVNFSATASDTTSGISGGFTWVFGDNTANGAGPNVSHTYTVPGTFQASATISDGAGNAGVGNRTITVNPSSGGNPPPPPGGNPPPPPGGNPPPPPGGNPPPPPPGTVQCKVPRVVGKTLAAAKTALTRAHCRLGTVKKAYSAKRKGRIIKQAPAAGQVRANLARVNVTVSRGKRP